MDRQKTNEPELSGPGPLMTWVESTVAKLSPQDALRFYTVTNNAARRKISHLLRWKISRTSAGEWSEDELRRIKRYFGVDVLPAPGPLERTGAGRAGR